MPRWSPLVTKSIPEVHLATSGALEEAYSGDQEFSRVEGLQAAGDSTVPLHATTDGGIHVYAHRMGNVAIHSVGISSDEVSERASLDSDNLILLAILCVAPHPLSNLYRIFLTLSPSLPL